MRWGVSSASGGAYTFGLVRRGSERLAQLTIQNDAGGGGTLNLTGTPLVTKTGGDAVITVSSQPGVSSLVPGAETTFIVRFAPVGGASPTVSASATFSIESNDPATPVLFSVEGSGTRGA